MRPKREISSLQVARGLAATCVVLHHTIRAFTIKSDGSFIPPALITDPRFYDTLAFGVDLFFVISGFIMVHVSQTYFRKEKPVSDFVMRRILRIFPAYLLVTMFLIALTIFQSYRSGNLDYDLSSTRLLSSLTLFPTYNQDGLVTPILGVGWTLSYEVYFYILFAISVRSFGNRFFLPLTVLILGLMVIGKLGPENFALFPFIANPIVLEFLFGCAIALYSNHARNLKSPLLLGLASLAVIFLSPTQDINDTWRCLWWGLPSALIILTLLVMEERGFRSWPALLRFIGDASYSIYLLHILFINLIGRRLVAFISGYFSSPMTSLGIVLLIWLLSMAAGILMYVAFEKPVQRMIKLRMPSVATTRI